MLRCLKAILAGCAASFAAVWLVMVAVAAVGAPAATFTSLAGLWSLLAQSAMVTAIGMGFGWLISLPFAMILGRFYRGGLGGILAIGAIGGLATGLVLWQWLLRSLSSHAYPNLPWCLLTAMAGLVFAGAAWRARPLAAEIPKP